MVITLPNILTFLRILAVPFFAIAVWYGRMTEACILFVAAGLTDALDGYLARRFNQRTALGAILDPAADKLLITTAFILLAFPREAGAVRIPPWVTILAISRDVVISMVTLLAFDHLDPSKFKPSILGKLTTLVAFAAIRVTPKGMLWLDMTLFAVVGFFVYTPVMFSGVMSLDLTTKKAVGTAAGFVGFFGYVGRVIQGKGLGWLAQHYGWDPALWAVLGCTAIGIILLAFLWNVRPRG